MAPKKNNGQLTGAARDAQSAKVQQKLSNPQVGQRPGETATVYAPGQAVPTTSNSTTNKPTSLGQALRIAGTGGITREELQRISDTTGRSGGQVIKRLDALNQKLKDKDKVGISLNSGAANMLIKQDQKEPTGMFGMSDRFGTGQIGKALQGMLGTPGSAGYMRQGQMVGGRQGIPGTGRMMGGTAIRPGGRPTVRGFGKQYAGTTQPAVTETPTTGAGTTMPTTAPVTPEVTPMIPEVPKEETMTPQSMPGSFVDLANWNTGFKSARSSRQKAGRKAQGLGQKKVAPQSNVLGI